MVISLIKNLLPDVFIFLFTRCVSNFCSQLRGLLNVSLGAISSMKSTFPMHKGDVEVLASVLFVDGVLSVFVAMSVSKVQFA